MNWKTFDDDSTPLGIEGKWDIKNDTLVVYVNPTSKGLDWVLDCVAFPVPVQFLGKLGLCHAGFKSYAYWLTGMIHGIEATHIKIERVLIIGYSMGGGVAQIAGLLCEEWMSFVKVKTVSIDGPRTTTKLAQFTKLIRNKYSLVADIPPWFKQAKNIEVLSDEKRPFWKAHADYSIESIINKETE